LSPLNRKHSTSQIINVVVEHDHIVEEKKLVEEGGGRLYCGIGFIVMLLFRKSEFSLCLMHTEYNKVGKSSGKINPQFFIFTKVLTRSGCRMNYNYQ